MSADIRPVSRSNSRLSVDIRPISRSNSRLSADFRPVSRSVSHLSNKEYRPRSRPSSRISHIIPIFEDGRKSRSQYSETISINSKLFDDDQIRTSLRDSHRSVSQLSRSFSEDRQSLIHNDRRHVSTKLELIDKQSQNVNNSDVDGSLILETDYYVRQMKQRRNQVALKNDKNSLLGI